MDIKLIEETIRWVGKKTTVGGYSERNIEILTNECSQELVKLFCQPVVISSLPSECQNGWENSDYCMERGKCKKCL